MCDDFYVVFYCSRVVTIYFAFFVVSFALLLFANYMHDSAFIHFIVFSLYVFNM